MKNLILMLLFTFVGGSALACMPPQNELVVQPGQYQFVIDRSIGKFRELGAQDLASIVHDNMTGKFILSSSSGCTLEVGLVYVFPSKSVGMCPRLADVEFGKGSCPTP